MQEVTMSRLWLFSIAIAMALCAAALPARAQSMPEEVGRAILIKQTLLTFNDANISGDYSVFRALSSTPFSDSYTVEELADIFKVFHDQAIDLAAVVEYDPVYSSDPVINSDGLLMLYGYFDTRPSIVHFELEFFPEEGAWRMISINVNLAPPDDEAKAK